MFGPGEPVTRSMDRRFKGRSGALGAPKFAVLLASVGVALTLGVVSPFGASASTKAALPAVHDAPAAAAALPTTASGRYVVAGYVNAMARAGGTVYVGGEFNRIADRTGSAIVVPARGGAPEPVRAEISGGSVSAAISGGGGWYVGGSFTNVGDARRDGLAHLRPDGMLDPAFAPADLGEIRALALAGGVLYVGAVRPRVGVVLRALDAATGAALPVTYMLPEGAGDLRALLADGGRLYAAFSELGIVAYDAVSGTRVWTSRVARAEPGAVGVVTIAIDGARLLVGGGFADRGRKNLEVLDATTGALVGRRLQVQTTVSSIVVVGGTVYLARRSRPASSGLATVDLATGALRPWGAIWPETLAAEGTTVYAAERDRVYAARAGTAHAVLRHISPPLAGEALTLAPRGSHVLIGGTFTGAGGAVRHNLAAFDARTGALGVWRPNASDQGCCGVSALAVAGRKIYFAGYFKRVSGSPRSGLAAVSADGAGRLLSWRPRLWSSGINALAVGRGRVFAGGSSLVLDRPKPRVQAQSVNLVAFSARGRGARIRFAPRLGTAFEVEALAVWRRTLIVGGQSLIAFPAGGDGRHELWRRQTDDEVFAFAIRGTTLYAGGNFSRVSGRPRRSLAAFALNRHGALLPFAPAVPIAVWALAPYGADLVFGGEDIDVQSRQVLGAVAWDGRLEPWRVDVPPGGGSVERIAPLPGGLLVAGTYNWLGPAGQQAAGGIGWLR